jgi:hypothetical protein
MTYDRWKTTNPADAELGNAHADQRKIVTRYWAKPFPLRQFDWEASYDGDEPNDAGYMAVGHGRTEAEAIADLFANYPREEDGTC